MTLKELQKECYRIAKEHGWHDEPRNPLVVAALFHSEISEFVEEIRYGRPPKSFDIYETKPCGPAIELADLAIRLLDSCEEWGIDLEYFIKIKNKYNETRPYRHGNKTA